MPILKIAHYRQQQQADCLAACALMALTHLGIHVRYARLLRLLQVKSFGASFYNLVL
jgi:ABC-type bacteriocin/lantibiotic exporter with double-glycine peptidase domain